MQKKLAIIVCTMLLTTLGAIISNEATLHAQETKSFLLPSVSLDTTQEHVSQPAQAVPGILTKQVGEFVIHYERDVPVPPPLLDVNTKELDCLAKNIYHEARGEDRTGMIAVAFVTKNRVHYKQWPSSICGVVYQHGHGGCQFSWTCRGGGSIADKRVWATTLDIARDILSHKIQTDPTHKAVFYHNQSVRPGWSRSKLTERTVAIGNHTFYKLTRG